MNSYFASVEQQDNLSWRGKPVGVCEHLGGIIIAASVEAKKWGIKTGTPVWEAKKLYPKIILTQTHAERYRFYTRRFLKVVGDYTDKVEKYSIDECFLDLTRVCNVRNFFSPSRANPNAPEDEPRDLLYQTDPSTPRPFGYAQGDPELNRTGRMHSLVGMGQFSIDPFEEAANIAREIKRRFKTEVGDWLRCSVGIADNKALAKIASDLKKPDGLTVIHNGCVGEDIILPRQRADDIRPYSADCLVLSKGDLYHQLKLTDVPGIGRRQERNLNELGIKTLKDLRDFPRSHLVARFGRVAGHHLYNLGQLEGTWKAEVHQEQEIKSMGHMYTLPQEFRKPEFFVPVLYKLCEMVGRRLRKKQLMGNVISCYYHDKDYQGFGDSKKLRYFLQDGREIFLECLKMIKPGVGAGLKPAPTGIYPINVAGIKLIGVTVAGLRPYIHQMSLFGDIERQRALVAALDDINDKYGEFTVLRAQMMAAGKAFRDSVGFGRVKEL